MKILGIDGSPRKDGNSEKLMRRILAGAEDDIFAQQEILTRAYSFGQELAA